MSSENLIELANKYKLGQKVFFYTPPHQSTSPESSPVWSGQIEKMEVKQTVSIEFGETEFTEKTDVKLHIEMLWDRAVKRPEEVFTCLDDAKKHARTEFAEIMDKRSKYTDTLKEAMAALEAQNPEDD